MGYYFGLYRVSCALCDYLEARKYETKKEKYAEKIKFTDDEDFSNWREDPRTARACADGRPMTVINRLFYVDGLYDDLDGEKCYFDKTKALKVSYTDCYYTKGILKYNDIYYAFSTNEGLTTASLHVEKYPEGTVFKGYKWETHVNNGILVGAINAIHDRNLDSIDCEVVAGDCVTVKMNNTVSKFAFCEVDDMTFYGDTTMTITEASKAREKQRESYVKENKENKAFSYAVCGLIVIVFIFVKYLF